MGYSLSEDEHVVMELRPHWKALVRPVLVLLLVALAGGFLFAALPDDEWIRWTLLGVGLLSLVLGSVVPWLRWRTTHFVITDRRVLMRSGIIARSGRDLPLSRINDVSFEHSVLERLLRCGTLVVESAGERGQVTLSDIPRVEEVHRRLYELVEAQHDER